MFALFQFAALAASVDSCAVSFELRAPISPGHIVAAELTSAVPVRRRPTVILINGAGAYPRDYSTDTGDGDLGNRAFAILRDSLVRAGYAVVRFDERGTGASTGDYPATATTHSLASDVDALIDAVSRHAAVDAGRIVLLGHSEGAVIASLVAARHNAVQAVVSWAGPAWRGTRVVAWQRERLAMRARERVSEDTVRKWLAAFDREHASRRESELWYQQFLNLDPLDAAARVRQPLLVLHGADDDWVSAEQAAELADAARAAGNARVTLIVLPDHDHAFGEPGDRSYQGRLSSRAVRETLGWLRREVPSRVPAECRD